ncbi:FISUMP domain-containing protein [uncultured Fibrobacter sp.]|uniref:FISUMP domain-containing protein n=1 Tax=uncultured Fibrobacter sp. TaxID=261512 RepID=UPI0025F76F97|nr:FISUMP domain-containing protein [uncultured Fibrobacter sp.]
MQNSFSLWVIATALILWGCSSDSGSNADGTQTVQSLSDLGECTTSKEGSVAWIESENKGYICSMGNWVYDAQIINPSIGDASTQLGTITDARDGQQYKTVEFDGVTWLAQNLNYAIENLNYVTVGGVADSGVGSQCVLNSPHYCNISGRIYSWDAAKNVCPEGWRLPSNDDFMLLLSTVSDNVVSGDGYSEIRDAEKLRSQVVPHWNGTDDYGFSAIPDNSLSTAFFSSSVHQADDELHQLYPDLMVLSYFYVVADGNAAGFRSFDLVSNSPAWHVRCIKN